MKTILTSYVLLIMIAAGGCTVQELIGAARDSDTDSQTSDSSATPTDQAQTDSADSATSGTDLDTDTDSETGSDVGTDSETATETDFVRVSFSVPDTASVDYLWVDAATNAVGLQGQWFAYNDSQSTNTVRNEGGGTLCVSGEVARYTGAGWTFGGLGFNLCNNGPDLDPIYEVHRFGTCPLVPDLADRFVGVSFAISGYPLPGVSLQFKTPDTINPPYNPLNAPGSGEYAFTDALVSQWDTDPVSAAELNSIQFIVEYSADAPVPFDFCVSDVQVILKP